MLKATYYVGANNTTGEVEKKKALSIFNKYYEGYTVDEVVGYWQGKPEKSIAITILSNDDRFKKLAKELKLELKQDCILYTLEIVDEYFI